MVDVDATVDSFDVVILGGGKGGKTLAMKLGHAGKRVLLIEKSRTMVGGSCINVACIPTKAFITAARELINCQRAAAFGITGASGAKADWPAVRKRVFELVAAMRSMNQKNLESTPNLEFVIGEGKFCAEKTIEIKLEDGQVRKVTGDAIVINTGTRPSLPVAGGAADKSSGKIEGSHLLVALGRKPNTETLDLGLSGIYIDKRGFIKVDEKLETSCAGVYAIGDVNGGPQFTHVSFDDHRIVKDHLIGQALRSTSDRQVPFVLFTEPEISRVGITEKEAVEQNLDVEIVKVPLSVVPRAKVSAETDGFMKAIIDRTTKRISGCTIVGLDAGNILAVVQMAMLGDLPFNKVRDAVFSHPTMPEGLIDLFCAVKTGDY